MKTKQKLLVMLVVFLLGLLPSQEVFAQEGTWGTDHSPHVGSAQADLAQSESQALNSLHFQEENMLDPALWQEVDSIAPERAEEEIAAAGIDSWVPIVPNAAEAPVGLQPASADTPSAGECYWSALLDEQEPSASSDSWERVQVPDAFSGDFIYRNVHVGTSARRKLTVQHEWNVPGGAVERWVRYYYRGTPDRQRTFTTVANHSDETVVEYLPDIENSNLSDEWKLYQYKLDDAHLTKDLDLWIWPSLDEGSRIEVDQAGIFYCYPDLPWDQVFPDILGISEEHPSDVIIPVLAAVFMAHGGTASNVINDVGLTSAKWMMERGMQGQVLGTNFFPGSNPMAMGDVKGLDGLGPWMSRDISYATKWALDFNTRRGFNPDKAAEVIARLNRLLVWNKALFMKQQHRRVLLQWVVDKLNYYNTVIKPNPMYQRMLRTPVVYVMEVKKSEMTGPFKDGMEWFVKSGKVDWSRLRILIFSADAEDDVIVATYQHAIRNGAPRSALRVVKGDMVYAAGKWSRFVGDLKRGLPGVIAYGGSIESLGAATSIGQKLYAIALETGGIVAPAATGAVFITGVGDAILKSLDYNELEAWETGLSWGEYVLTNHGYTRILMDQDIGSHASVYQETELTYDQFRPLRFKIPEHDITCRSYYDGGREFLEHPAVESYMEWRISDVVLDDNDGNFGYVTIEKKVDGGPNVFVDISFEIGQNQYSMVYDHPDCGLISMTFELIYVRQNSENDHFTIGVSYFSTQAPEQYGACIGWSTSRPEHAPCYTGDIPAEDYVEFPDFDGDGVHTLHEGVDPNRDLDVFDSQDTNADELWDYMDPDDDGDGLLTRFEGADPNGDGNPIDARDSDYQSGPDYLDWDDDGDGTPTIDERADPNGDGNPDDAYDGNGNGIPAYLDANEHPEPEPVPTRGPNTYLPYVSR